MQKIGVFWHTSRQQIDEFHKLPVSELRRSVAVFFNKKAAAEENVECDIDKAWDGLNYIFCSPGEKDEKNIWPNNFILAGEKLGQPNPDPEPNEKIDPSSIFRWYSVDQVKEISKFLDTWNREKLREKYDPVKMDEVRICPTGFTNYPGAMFDYLYENFEPLRCFMKKAVDAKDCVMVRIR